MNASTGVLERQTGTLANDTCSGFGGFSTVASPDTVASGHCAAYRYRLADNAGTGTQASTHRDADQDAEQEPCAQRGDDHQRRIPYHVG